MSNQTTEIKQNLMASMNWFIFIMILLMAVGWLHLGTLLITVLFSFFALEKLSFLKNRWVTITTFTSLVFIICFGLAFFITQAIQTLPRVAATSIPIVIQYAKEYSIELPFTDLDSLKEFALDSVKSQIHQVGNFANEATKQTIFLIIGIVVAIALYLESRAAKKESEEKNNHSLYDIWANEIAEKFHSFYISFRKVMGAQLLISAINTALTSIFVIYFSFPYAPMVIAITFLCGLLPIIGNLISNTIIVGIGFTIAPKMALFALIFLIVLHKLEYFLNSKIIGHRIKNPVWLTLIGLIIGERLLGITGMILAPVVLHFVKIEASKIKFKNI